MPNGIILNEKVPTGLLTSDFDYDLPEELIAQSPAERRDGSRLMVLDRKKDAPEHHVFSEIVDFLNPEDILVVNSSKVIPARLLGVTKKSGGTMELLLLKKVGEGRWETLVRPGKRAKAGAVLLFGDGLLRATVETVLDDGNRVVSFDYDRERFASDYELLDAIGELPLPPYIHKKQNDLSRYQTVYAKEEGSAAAPTAGLHFTPELLDAIRKKGVGYAEVTLHIGLGTFRPVKEKRIADHLMHTEHFHIDQAAADEINRRRRAGGRVVAVGTTSCRVLESVADENGFVRATEGDTGIFIYPGYRFRAVDALITNFHLPQSTLLMLVSALAGRERVLAAYKTAVEERYRFFSFGDAMFIE